MQKEVLKKLEYEMFVVAISLVLTALMYFLITPSLTGFVVLQPALATDSLINSSNNEYKLKSYNSISYIINEVYSEASLTQATYDSKDELDKVNAADVKSINTDKDNIFDIKFNKALNNEDKIYFKTKVSDPSSIYLCDASTQCSSPGYGSVQYNGDESWYSITLSGLSSQKDTFNLDPTKVKFDFINASRNETTIQVNSSTPYYKSGIVETQDIQPSDLSKWDMFYAHSDINPQNILYEYSTDSGQTWNSIINYNLSSVNSPKIKLRANLTSEGISTPILYNMYLNYSALCTENWVCTSWSSCTDGTQTRTCTESNSCGSSTNKPAESQECFYAKDFYLLNQTNIINIEENKLTTLNFTNSQLKVKTSSNITLNFNISENTFHSSTPSDIESAKKFIEVITTLTNLTEATLRVYYSDQDVSNLNEDTLKIYYYNEQTSSWESITSIVSTQQNYVEANITHFSTYGIFGSESQSGSSPSSDRKSDSKIAPPPTSVQKAPAPTPSPSQPTAPPTQTQAPSAPTPAPTTQPTPVTPPSSESIVTGQVIKTQTALNSKPLAFIIMGAVGLFLLIIIHFQHSRHKNLKKPQEKL